MYRSPFSRHANGVREHLARAEQLLGDTPEARDVGILKTGQSWLAALEGDGVAAVARAREALDALKASHGGASLSEVFVSHVGTAAAPAPDE